MSLEAWGWDARWAKDFEDWGARGLAPARVTMEQRGLYRVAAADGERDARIPGAMRHKAEGKADLPAVGDWVGIENDARGAAMIRAILPRRAKLSRKAAGETQEEQVIAANLDAVFVTTALNADFNARRLERFLTVTRESGAETVVVLNKLDMCPDPQPYIGEARLIAGGAAVVALSAATGQGMEVLAEWLKPGRTVGLIGTSGVGKSTLLNRLAGEELLATAETRARDERGRHTTTHRQLFILPSGAILLDTPGMREMQFWDAEQGLVKTFDEITALAPSCRFKDCGHDTEPGCAVKAAVDAGTLPAERLAAWSKLKKEVAHNARKADPAVAAAEKRKSRAIHKALKKSPKKE